VADHDNGYKLLFSHALMVADLLRGFVKERWVQELDLSTLERVSGGYVSDDLRDRESDVVWRVKLRRGGWIYVYLLLEFQSTVDAYMSLRILTYLGLLYQDLLRQGMLTPSGKLPPVLPIVLYNGYRPWHAALDISELIEEVPGGLERYRPSLRYCLLDELRLAESDLDSIRNLAAALFRLEQGRGPQEIRGVLSALTEWLKEPEHESLRRAFRTWLVRVLLPSRAPGIHIPDMRDLEEVKMLLEEEGIDWSRTWVQQGREEGREKGREEGVKQSLQTLRPVVLAQMEQRFGQISEETRRQVEAISSMEELARILGKILKAGSLADLDLP
jgi:predicted transposase/invertase (TIGR01784 family)